MQFLQEWSERDRGLALALHEYELTTGRSASDVVGGELKASLAMAAADNMDLAQATSSLRS